MEKHAPGCNRRVIHYDIAESVKAELPGKESAAAMARLFGVLGDGTRMGILLSLDRAELCVCDLCYLLEMTTSAVSHQLRVLRDENLVKNRREGRVIYYSLADSHVKDIIERAVEHINEQAT